MLNAFQQGEDIMRRKELEQVRLIVKLLNMLRGMKGMEPLSYKEEIWKMEKKSLERKEETA